MKWYGIDEDIYKSLVDLITEAYDAAERMGDKQSETYYAYLLGELEECKVIAKTKRMNSEEEQRMLKLQRYLRMLHEGLKDPDKNTDKDKKKRRKVARDAIDPTPKKKHVPTYMSLKEIEKYLIDDPELSNYERFELYCDERDRVQAEEEAKNAQSLDDMLDDLGIEPFNPKKK
jgi:hypothetical protein